MAKHEGVTAYRQFAIMTALFTYFNMKDFGDKICELLSDKKRELKVTEAREKSVVLKRDRNTILTESDMVDVIGEAVKDLIDSDSRVEAQIAETYEFDYSDKDVTKAFVEDNFDILFNGKTVVIDIEK